MSKEIQEEIFKNVGEAWKIYCETVLTENITEEAKNFLRKTFYAGAIASLSCVSFAEDKEKQIVILTIEMEKLLDEMENS